MKRPTPPALTARQLGIVALAVLALAGPLLYHFKRNHQVGRLSQAGYETVQAARYLADKRAFRTQAIRPLETRYVRKSPDGSLADLRHGPLHLAVNAVAIKALKETGPGRGDRAAVFLQLFLLGVGVAATAWLSRKLFGAGLTPGYGLPAAALFALGGSALKVALEPDAGALAALGMIGLVAALLRLDGETYRYRALGRGALVGALWGLVFLSLYSALVFLPLLAIYVFRSCPRRWPALIGLLAAAALVALPVPLRAWQATGNPLYHSRLLELVMHTDTYPSDSLYQLGSMPRSVPSYLADGGYKEVGRKLVRHVQDYIPLLLGTIGPLVALLLAASALIRFADPRLNRLRTLALGLIGAHLLGLALFFPAETAGGALFVHAPLAATLAAGCLDVLVRARRLPAFFARTALLGWLAAGCVPGLLRLGASSPVPESAPAMFDWLYTGDPQMKAFQTRGSGVLISDIAGEVAFRHSAPCLLLPSDSLEVATCEERLERPVEGVLLSPLLEARTLEKDPVSVWWREAQTRTVGYWNVASGLPSRERGAFLDRYPLIYPSALKDALQLQRPLAIGEPGTGKYSLVFWYNGPTR